MTRATPLVLLAAFVAGCAPPDPADIAGTREGQVEVYFNEAGTRPDNLWTQPYGLQAMLRLIHNAESTLDFAVMGFTHPDLVDAVEMAFDRGVQVRMVGDAKHWNNLGYQRLLERSIPMSVGNSPHIMHNKFVVVDGRYTFVGTANWSKSDMLNNSNNMLFIDHPGVAADFTAEFEQMFDGRFGYVKDRIENGRVYQVGDTEVEVWFSPNEDTMGRMLEVVDAARESVRFTIFAFTKDQVGSAFIRKQQELAERWADDPDQGDELPIRSVAGVIDQSQLHSNGQYHEAYRLGAFGVKMRLDGFDMSLQPGDYQAGGGRLHSKTMLIDTYTEDPEADPTVMTGSFNWSAAATISNDEYLIVLRGSRVGRQYNEYFEHLWDTGRHLGSTWAVDPDDDEGRATARRLDKAIVAPGDIVVNEVHWYGVNSSDVDGFDQFIELRNLTDRDLHLDMWSITNATDFVVGLPPGSFIPANGRFVIADHVIGPYRDGEPQAQRTAIATADLVLNSFNDNRQARLYLKGSSLELYLRDPRGRIVDRAGDGGAAFAGGPIGGAAFSMERREDDPGAGDDPARWYTCTAPQGGTNINPAFRAEVIATPGEANSAPR
jgi:phosphatidylserine/phosphatidylglycerophosphate/cardiolipin synthase-like enzyme